MARAPDDSLRATNGNQPPNVKCHLINDEIVRRLAAHDPDIEGLALDGRDVGQLRNDDFADSLGRAISSSKSLHTLQIVGDTFIPDDNFFVWLAHNRSIEEFGLYHWKPTHTSIYRLAQFFEYNTRLRYIAINYAKDASNEVTSLIAALVHSGENRLQKISLYGSLIKDKKCAELIDALNEITGLHNLLELILGSIKLGRKSCVAISELIRNPDCRIQTLDLSNSSFSDDCMLNLISGLATNTSIKVLDFLCLDLTRTGWHVFFVFLSSPACSIETITTSGDIPDESATSLGSSLAVNLKSLSIGRNCFTSEGWREVGNGLRAPSSTLVEPNFELCDDLYDEGAVAIFEALANNQTLKNLSFGPCLEITSDGWVTCFRLLEGSLSALEKLQFESNNIDDEGAKVLVNLLSRHMSTVWLLSILYCDSITAVGWRAFADVLLPNSTSKLASLQLEGDLDDGDDNRMNDDDVRCFITALSNNSSLVELSICGLANVSQSSLDPLVHVLCDKTSIASVCNSNHTLSLFRYTFGAETKHPRELASLLELNKNKDKAEVVREKILTSSVINEDNVVHEFGLMPVTVFPSLIEWIGRDRLGYSVMHSLVQGFPSLLSHLTGSDADDH